MQTTGTGGVEQNNKQMQEKRSGGGRMKAISSKTGQRSVIRSCVGSFNECAVVERQRVIRLGEKDLVFVFQLAFRIVLIFLFFLLQLFGQLTFTVTMQFGPGFVLTQRFRDLVLVLIKISYDKDPVKGLYAKCEQ